MPDYSKSIIYKIQHINKPELVYVGSTTNFIQRKNQHKSDYKNENKKSYNLKLYQTIRCNDGWESFKIMIISDYPCNNKTELLIEEEKYKNKLKASLNIRKSFCSIQENKEQNRISVKNHYYNNKNKIKNL